MRNGAISAAQMKSTFHGCNQHDLCRDTGQRPWSTPDLDGLLVIGVELWRAATLTVMPVAGGFDGWRGLVAE